MSKTKKLLATLVVVGLIGTVSGWATFSAFSSSTSSAGNTFAAGTVQLGSNSLGSFMYQVTEAKPGTTVSKCTKVTYTGSLDADVKLYAAPPLDGLAYYVNLTVTPGTGSPTFPGCTGFTAAGSAIFNGTLQAFAETYNGVQNGLAVVPDGATKWSTNSAVVYQFTLTLQDNNNANGGSTGLSIPSHAYTWHAVNQ